MSGLTTTHSFPAALEDGSTVRIEATTHTPDGRRVMLDADGLAYVVGSTALKLVRSPDDDREPVGSSYVEPVANTVYPVAVFDANGMFSHEVRVRKLAGRTANGRAVFVDSDGIEYISRGAPHTNGVEELGDDVPLLGGAS